MKFLSKAWKGLRKISNFLGLGIPNKIHDWLKPDLPPAQAVMVEKQGSDVPIPVVYGTRRIGAIKVHKYVTDASGGAQNEYLHIIAVLCEGEVDGIVDVMFSGVSETDSKWNKKGGGKWFTLERYLGTPNQPASASAVSQIPNWTIDHQLNGLAYLYIRVQMDKDQNVWRGEPEITATVRGLKIHDPRNNVTAYSANPALQLLDYLKNPIYGKGLSESRLNLQSFIDAADLCDQTLVSNVTIDEITTELSHKRFTSNIVLDTGGSVFNNVSKLLTTMRGTLPIGGGVIRLGIEDVGEPVFFFGHDRSAQPNYATITGPIKSKTSRKSDRYNRVIVRFPNINTNFENDEVFYPPSNDPLAQQWLDEDNGVRLEQSFEFDGITSKAEAYQMAEIIAKRSRNANECTFPASPLSIIVEPGDIVALTDDTRGWADKPFRVRQVKLNDDGDCEFEVVEHQNAIYPWSGVDYEDRIGGTNLGDPANIPAPTGLSIAPDPTLATAGMLTWNSVSNAFIRRFDVSVFSGTTLVYSQEVLAPVFAVPLLAAGAYSIEVYAVSTIGTRSPGAVISYNLTAPTPPQSITVIASNFELDCRPQLTGAGLGTQFEFAIGTTDVVRGRGANIVFAGLVPGTEYTVFARTVNALGVSGWANVVVSTTADGSAIANLIGEDVAATIFDDVVTAVQADLQTTVDNSLADVPNNTEVQQLIDNSIAQVNAADSEDPRVDMLVGIMAVLDEHDNRAEIKRTDFVMAQEQQIRAAAILELTAADAAILQQVQQVETDLSGNSSALNALIATVNNPANGLSASFSLAQNAKTTADGNASSISVLQNTVTSLDSGLTATTSLAQSAKTTADGNASSITQINNTVNNQTTGLSATFTLASNTASSLASLQTKVTGIDNDLAAAELTLQSTVNDLGEVSARAFLGVTTVSGGVARINGIVIDGVTNSLEFRTNTFRWTDTAGNVQAYWDASRSKAVWLGDLVAGTFQTAITGYRAEMSGAGSIPFWYGTGTKTIANAAFAVDTSGNVTLRNATVQGKIVTSEGTGIRVDVGNDGTYLIWAGTGDKTDVNGLFWIKANGQGFVKGDFFSGQIIESRLGSVSNGGSIPATATAPTHASAGKPVEVSASVSVSFRKTGNTASQLAHFTLAIKRGSTTLTTVPFIANGFYEAEDTQTLYNGERQTVVVDNSATAGDRSYSAVLTQTGGATPNSNVLVNLTVKTFENKLG